MAVMARNTSARLGGKPATQVASGSLWSPTTAKGVSGAQPHPMPGPAPAAPVSANPNGQPAPGGDFDSFMSRYGNGAPGGKLPQLPRVKRATLDREAIAAGDAAAYSQAKDQVGDSTSGLMKALGNQFSSRGLRGSSIEGQAMGSGLEAGMGELADVSREQAIQGSKRSTDLAVTNYGGDITQRAQDIGQNVAGRGQDIEASRSRLSSILGLWNAHQAQRY